VKNIFILLTPIFIIITALGCSKDHTAPTFSKYVTPKPTNVQATFDPDNDVVEVTWDMDNPANVKDYYVAVSDSSLFDMGYVFTKVVGSTEKKYTLDVTFVPSSDVGKVLYITVSAIFDSETLKNFVGPRADNPANVLVKR
jgi:hypothetical protein